MDADKASVLRVVKRRREAHEKAAASFRSSVIYASGFGCSLREIARAAGYTSVSPVQNILKDK